MPLPRSSDTHSLWKAAVFCVACTLMRATTPNLAAAYFKRRLGGNDVETHETVDWAAILISVSQQLWHHTLNP